MLLMCAQLAHQIKNPACLQTSIPGKKTKHMFFNTFIL